MKPIFAQFFGALKIPGMCNWDQLEVGNRGHDKHFPLHMAQNAQ